MSEHSYKRYIEREYGILVSSHLEHLERAPINNRRPKTGNTTMSEEETTAPAEEAKQEEEPSKKKEDETVEEESTAVFEPKVRMETESFTVNPLSVLL